MKTAMQELIEFIESTNNTPHVNLTIMDKAKKLLEKEKEQIIEAGNACSIKTIVHRENLDKMSEDELRNSLVEDTISHGEDYYNQTFNQNELPKTYINSVEVESDNNNSVMTNGEWNLKANYTNK
jgi:hypothetical protein